MNLLIKILLPLWLTLLITSSCREQKSDFATKQRASIQLGSAKKYKTLEVEWPFEVSIKDNMDGWRSTANQPYCKTYQNDSLEFRFCHTYTEPSNSYLLDTPEEISEYTQYSYDYQISEEAKKFPGHYSSTLLQQKINQSPKGQSTQSGFIIHWEHNSLFKKYYSWRTLTEYLDLEITARSKTQLHKDSYSKEIEFVLTHMKGIPVPNKS